MRCTMQVCTTVCGNTASIASGNPVRPSTQQMRMSETPRCRARRGPASRTSRPPFLETTGRARRGCRPSPPRARGSRPCAPPTPPSRIFKHQRVEEHHRVDVLQRPGLPRPRVVHDRVGDPADQVPADRDAVELAQVRLDIPGGHAPRVERQDPLVKPLKPPLTLAHQLRFKAPVTIARRVDLNRPVLGASVLGVLPLRWLPVPPGGSWWRS